MSKIDAITDSQKKYFISKNVIEVACGDSHFSISVAKYANSVTASDISLSRAKKIQKCHLPRNLSFLETDAVKICVPDGKYDVAVCYNALKHIDQSLERVFTEMVRITCIGGYIMFISTWKIDFQYFTDIENISLNTTNILTISDSLIKTSGFRSKIFMKI